MRNFSRRTLTALKAGLLGLGIALLAGGVWANLYVLNLKTTPQIPWATVPMALYLWGMWKYLGGKGWPQSASEVRRELLRARPVSLRTCGWVFVAGALSIAALAGLWIVLFQLVKMPGNALPDMNQYPVLTMAAFTVMGSLVSPFAEEAGLRGYCQVMLEREFRGPAAVLISSIFFALGHVNHGLLWPKVLVYFLVGVMFGAMAYLTKSIVPGIPVHMLGDITFFTMVWPYDAARRLVWEGGADAWFWLHVAQIVVLGALAFAAYRKVVRLLDPPVAHAHDAVAVSGGFGIVGNH